MNIGHLAGDCSTCMLFHAEQEIGELNLIILTNLHYNTFAVLFV